MHRKFVFLFLMLLVLVSCSHENTQDIAHSEADRKATEIGNMNNNGYAVEDEEGNIYFIATSDGSGHQLCGPESVIDGEKNFAGLKDIFTLFLKRQDWIYFLKREPCCLYRFNVETKEEELVFERSVSRMIEFEGDFYCITLPESGLWLLHLDASGGFTSELLVERGVRSLVIDRDQLCYTADETLYCDPHDPCPVASGINEDSVYAVEGTFYFASHTDQALYKIVDGIISKVNVSGLKYDPKIYFMNIAHGTLIMVAIGDSPSLRTYLFDPVTEKMTLLSTQGYGDIFVGGNDVYERLLSDTGVEFRHIGKLKPRN